MTDTVKTFSFTSDADSFSYTDLVDGTGVWSATGGDADAGCLYIEVSGRNKDMNGSWDRSLTFEDMGVPSGDTVTGITSASIKSKVTTYDSGAINSATMGAVTLTDGSTTVTLGAQRSPTGTDSVYQTQSGTDNTSLNWASNQSVDISIPAVVDCGNDPGTNFDAYWDTLTFTITHSSGGEEYERTLTVQVDLTDTQVRYTQLLRALTDNPELTDTLVRSALFTYLRTLSDSADLIDTLTSNVQSPWSSIGQFLVPGVGTVEGESDTTYYLVPRAGSVLLDWIEVGVTVYERTLTSSIDVSDQQDRYANSLRHLLESTDIQDSVLQQVLFFRTLLSSVDVSDEILSTVLRQLVRTLSDQFDLTDTITTYRLLSRLLQDETDALDTITTEALLNRLLSSSVDVIDQLLTARELYRALSSAVDMTDSITSQIVLETVRILADSVDVSDSLDRIVDFYRRLTEQIDANDTAAQALSLTRRIRDDVDLVDSLQSILERVTFITLIDQITMTDTQRRSTLLFRALFSPVDLEDSVTRNSLLLRTLASNVDLQDSITQQIAGLVLRVLFDSVTLTDSMSRETILRINRVLTESIAVADILERNQNLFRVLTDTTELDDALSRWVIEAGALLERYLSSSVDVSDALKQDLRLSRALGVSLYLYDEISLETRLQRALGDNIELNDALNVSILQFLVRTLLDQVDLTDTLHSSFISALGEIGFIRFLLVQRNIALDIERGQKTISMGWEEEPITFTLEGPRL